VCPDVLVVQYLENLCGRSAVRGSMPHWPFRRLREGIQDYTADLTRFVGGGLHRLVLMVAVPRCTEKITGSPSISR
jgi:hypothetical protein